MTRAAAAAYTTQHDAHVYETSRWQRLLWTERSRASASIRGAVQDVARAVDTEQPDTDAATDFGGELFARLYNDPAKLADPQGPAWMTRAHELVGAEGAEFDALRAATEGDADMAALATRGLLRTVAEQLPALLEELEQEDEDGAQPGNGQGLGAGERLASALRRAARAAQEEVLETREALAGLAPGLESAPAGSEHDPRRMQLAERLRSDERLRDVLRRAGRIQRIARKRQQVRAEHAREEVVDLERGGDVSRILPSGLSRMHHPLLRKLAMREIVERTALQYRLEGREPQGRGPIVVLLDESMSMEGEPHTWARAIGLAALGQAAREKRACTVIGFDTRATSCHRLTASGEAYDLGRSPSSPEARGERLQGLPELVLRVASIGTHGGTDYAQPVRFALGCGLREDRADLILVTDGLADIAQDALAELTAAKAKGLRVFGIVLNGGSLTPSVRAICDEVVELDRTADKGAALGGAIL